jgi:2-polyprenyl-3-methyl-5-hydroxy-6-metoxy-1,4-benzoquinol methylase
MNIIIGANGYIGSFLSYKLKETINVISDNDKIIENQINFSNFIKKWNNNEYNNTNIFIVASYIKINEIIQILKNNSNNNKFFLFSSAVIYDNIDKEIYEELDSLNFNSNDEYSKIIYNNENEFLKLNGEKIILRCGTVYGFAPNFDATRGINRMIYSSIINNKLIINKLNLKKSFVSLNEIYNLIIKILTNKLEQNNIYNVVSFSMSLHNLAFNLSKMFNIDIHFYESTKKEYEFYLSNEKINSKSISTLETIINDLTNNFNDLNYIKYNDNNKIINIWTKLKNCRVCKSTNIFQVLDLKTQSPPNRLSDVFYKFLSFPLKLNCCRECYHLQLEGYINPIIMFTNYTYLSGVTKTMNDYFKNFVESLEIIDDQNKTILDIACNDGCLLDHFKNAGYITYGIDPAENLVSNIKDHKIVCGFFNNESIEIIKEKYKINKFNIITAFNVFAHLDDIYDFMNNLDKISDENTDIYIQTSQCDMIKNNEFDTIYHEHLSFFSLLSIKTMLEKTKFYLFNLKIVSVHGNSYLFHIKKKINLINYVDLNIKNRLNYEIENKLYNEETYLIYKQNINNWINQLILNLKKDNNIIIGVGASAKGITILNYINDILNKNNIIIDSIIDENKLKINKIINTININIYSFEYIKNINSEITFILFAWNFQKELKDKIIKLRGHNNDKFIIPQIIEWC